MFEVRTRVKSNRADLLHRKSEACLSYEVRLQIKSKYCEPHLCNTKH